MFTVPALHSGKKGSLVLSSAKNTLEWSPSAPPGSSASVALSLDLSDMTGLQASPATATKNRMKITTAQSNFIFELPTRQNLDALKSALTSTSSSTPQLPKQKSISDADLLADTALQQSLLKSNPSLQQQFLDAVVDQHLPSDEFWRTRIPILRMQSLVQTQRRGAYNVLASIRPVTSTTAPESGAGAPQVRVSLSPDKIKDIFKQYPVVRRAYDDNVPPLAETAFWSRFFLSKLCRKLRGERIAATDAPDTVMDKYLQYDEDGMTEDQREAEIENTKVMRFVNVEANEMDDSQKAGNTPDFTMRQNPGKDTLSIIRTINKLSQKIVEGVENEADLPEQAQEQQKARELALNDLQPEPESPHIELHLRKAKQLSPPDSTTQRLPESSAAQVLDHVLSSVPKDNIHSLLSSVAVSQRDTATVHTHVFSLIGNRRQTEQSIQPVDTPTTRDLKLSHTTAVEFLHHFWTAFLSADPSRASTVLPILVASVDKSKTRLLSIVNSAPEQDKSTAQVRITLDALQLALTTYNTALAQQKAAHPVT
ncbi:hypothetical protein V1512DRAFT_223745 [Lipomyces arxii]|uniref:uncharacterized protein n=1 Tax=Lipomyces arxii TaxID=56418 RepID=UPI0034CD0778